MRTPTLRTERAAVEFVEDVFSRLRPVARPARFPGALRSLQLHKDAPWQMDLPTAVATIHYLFRSLRMKVYLLAVIGGKPDALARINAQPMDKTLRKHLVERMNGTLRWPVVLRGKRYDRNVLLKDQSLSFVQCRVQTIKEGPIPPEYVRFLESITTPLPDGVYVLTLTDAVIARKDRGDPFELGRRIEAPERLLPILNGSGHELYWDVPIANYDDLLARDLPPGVITDWDAKKGAAIFRGSATGCGYAADTNARLALASKSKTIPLLDAGVVSKTPMLKMDPKHGLGYVSHADLVGFKTIEEQSRCKYILHVEGNVAAFRLASMLRLGSVLLIVDSPFTLWYGKQLKPLVHYVPVKADLSDLESQLQWCVDHDEQCRAIAQAGKELAEALLRPETVRASFAKTLWTFIAA